GWVMTAKRILVADDNANIRKVVKMGFEALGYAVLTAEDGIRAMALVRAERPDLVLLDVMMPGKSGYDVCAEMKGDPALRSIPVVMLTAKNLEEDRYWGRELGADEYITKPYDPEELERIVEKIFALAEKGESYHPLTRLPLWAAVRHEIEQRRTSREPFVVLGCSLDPVSFETYQMKYGNIKADDVILRTSQLIRKATERAAGERGFLGHSGDNVFYVIIPPEAAGPLRETVDREFAAAVRCFYVEEDAARGCVIKSGPGGVEESIPLLGLVWKAVPDA
ncbi:MAG TPA: response regulator, partial [Candidatus Methanoperedens sp.]|nr:response regulator [Candidatus Methanoperedens sp.]